MHVGDEEFDPENAAFVQDADGETSTTLRGYKKRS